jgi:hypothetical protein
MSYRVKDYWKNTIAEFDTSEEMYLYVSSSQYTSSILTNQESSSLNYFQWDFDLHSNFESSSFIDDIAKQLIRVTYQPGEDDDMEYAPYPQDTGSIDSGSVE